MKDLSGHVNHGTITGTTDIAGKVGRARHFDGSGDRIAALAISVPATEFTVAAWFRWTTNPAPYYSGIQGGGFSWELRVQNDGRFGIIFYQAIGPDVYTNAASPVAYNDGEWHHAAGVLRSGLAELYVDGVLVARDNTNPLTSVRTSAQTIVGPVASGFIGDIDEVRVFPRALTAGEIAALASSATNAVLYSQAILPAEGCHFVSGDNGRAHEDTEKVVQSAIRVVGIGATWLTGGISQLVFGNVIVAVG